MSDEPDTRRVECNNCDWTGTVDQLGCQLDEVPDLLERIDAGDIVPVGECPHCCALAHLVEIPPHTIAAIRRQSEKD